MDCLRISPAQLSRDPPEFERPGRTRPQFLKITSACLSGIKARQQFLQITSACVPGFQPVRFRKNKVKHIQTVKVFTLDKIWKDNKDTIDFIKIDAEGWDYFVLKGGQKALEKYSPLLLMEFDEENIRQCNLTQEVIISFLKKLNYQVFFPLMLHA